MSEPLMLAGGAQVKVFMTNNTMTLEEQIQHWLSSLTNTTEIYTIKYVIVPRSGDNKMEIYSALIIYKEKALSGGDIALKVRARK